MFIVLLNAMPDMTQQGSGITQTNSHHYESYGTPAKKEPDSCGGGTAVFHTDFGPDIGIRFLRFYF